MLIKNLKAAIQAMLKLNNINQTILAERLGLTKGNCSRLLNRDDFKINNDLVKIGNIVGFDVEINLIDKKTGTTIKSSTQNSQCLEQHSVALTSK